MATNMMIIGYWQIKFWFQNQILENESVPEKFLDSLRIIQESLSWNSSKSKNRIYQQET